MGRQVAKLEKGEKKKRSKPRKLKPKLTPKPGGFSDLFAKRKRTSTRTEVGKTKRSKVEVLSEDVLKGKDETDYVTPPASPVNQELVDVNKLTHSDEKSIEKSPFDTGAHEESPTPTNTLPVLTETTSHDSDDDSEVDVENDDKQSTSQVVSQRTVNSESEDSAEDCEDLFDQNFDPSLITDSENEDKEEKADATNDNVQVQQNRKKTKQNSKVNRRKTLKRLEKVRDNTLKNIFVNLRKKGKRYAFKCMHQNCTAKPTGHFVQRIPRHYRDEHGISDQETVTKMQGSRMKTRVKVTISLDTIKDAFKGRLENTAFLGELKMFLDKTMIGVVTKKVDSDSESEDEDEEEDEDAVKEKQETASDAKQKLKDLRCSAIHKCLKLFKSAKLAVTKATNKERAVQTQAGYLSKIIGFVENCIGQPATEFSWLETPENHEDFLKLLQTAGMQDDAVSNYKKVMGNIHSYIFGMDLKVKECCWAEHLPEGFDKEKAMSVFHTYAGLKVTHKPMVGDLNRENKNLLDLSRYEPYFADHGRSLEILNEIVSIRGHYDDGGELNEVKDGWNFVARFLLCEILHAGVKRGGVPAEILLKDVLEAQKGEDGLFVISVSNHKTEGTHGASVIVLNEAQMDRMQQFAKLRRDIGLSEEWRSDKFLVGPDGGVVAKPYKHIQAWAEAENIVGPKYSSQTLRRTVQTHSHEDHEEEVFLAVSRQEDHLPTTAKKSYVQKTRSAVVKDHVHTQVVMANAVLLKEFSEGKKMSDLFPTKLLEPFLTKEEIEKKMKAETSHTKLIDSFQLSEAVYQKLKRKYLTTAATSFVQRHLPFLTSERTTIQKIRKFLLRSNLEPVTGQIIESLQRLVTRFNQEEKNKQDMVDHDIELNED